MPVVVLVWGVLLFAAANAAVLSGSMLKQGIQLESLQVNAAISSDKRVSKRASLDLQRVRQGSVRHYPIPGVITIRGGDQEAVLMHVYIRSQQRGDNVTFRGFMFAESVERDWYSYLDGYVCQPDVEPEKWPGVALREAGGKREHRLRVYTELIHGHQVDKPVAGSDYNRNCMPYPFKGEMTAKEAASDFIIAIDGFRKTVVFRAVRQRQMLGHSPTNVPDQPAAPALKTVIVLYPFTPSTDPEVAAALLAHHVSYHLQLGFTQLIQYTQASFVPSFLANTQLREHVRAGRLEIVLWEHLGECVGPPHMRCWQPLVYSHAVLQAWGCNTYLLISDIDEYFVLPERNSTLAGALRCTQNKPMVKVEWYDIFMSPEGQAALAKGEAEVALWRLPGRGPSATAHPLSLYSIQSKEPIRLGKGMVLPERVAAYEVHNGMVFTPTPDKDKLWPVQDEATTLLNRTCGYLVHMPNLFVARMRSDGRHEENRSWHWMFDKVILPTPTS